jgi:hypothetical protein
LIARLSGWSDGNFHKLLPARYVPNAYKNNQRTGLRHPRNFNQQFLLNWKNAIEACNCRREIFIPAMREAVRERLRTRGGPEEVTSQDLATVGNLYISL